MHLTSNNPLIEQRIARPASGKICILANARLGDRDIEELVTKLNNKPSITTLRLSGNNIGDVGAEQLAKLLHITDLDISNNNLGDAGVRSLLQSQAKFAKLNISLNNTITANTLTDCLTAKASLIELKYAGVGLDKDISLAEQIALLLKPTHEKINPQPNRNQLFHHPNTDNSKLDNNSVQPQKYSATCNELVHCSS